MELIEVQERSPLLIRQLLEIWEQSVKATHLFLSRQEIASIREYVPKALREVPHLMIAKKQRGVPVGFLGLQGHTLEMLFLLPEERGKGLGKQLLQDAMQTYGVRFLTVNEQNPSAKGFYEHMGFRVYRRNSHDQQGNPYPLFYMFLAP